MRQSTRWNHIKDFFLRDGWRKLVAVFLALLLYMAIAPRTGEKTEKTFHNVPVHIEIPANVTLSSADLRTVKLILSGNPKDLDDIDPGTLNIRATVHSEGVVPGVPYPLRLRFSDVIGLPYGVRVSSISPRDMPLDLEPVVSKQLKILPQYDSKDKLLDEFAIDGENLIPSSVVLTGPARLMNSINEVYTKPIPINSSVTRDFEYVCNLDILPGIRADRREIKAYVKVSKVFIDRTYTVPIKIFQTAEHTRKYMVSDPEPANVTVTLRGTNRALAMLAEKDIAASVSLENINTPNTYALPVKITINNNEHNITVQEFTPQSAKVTVK